MAEEIKKELRSHGHIILKNDPSDVIKRGKEMHEQARLQSLRDSKTITEIPVVDDSTRSKVSSSLKFRQEMEDLIVEYHRGENDD